MVPPMSAPPAPVAAAAMAIGTTTTGSAIVSVAPTDAATMHHRGMGRSQRYTRVPSSFGSPSTDDARSNVVTGTATASPYVVIMIVPSSIGSEVVLAPMAMPRR